MMFVTVADSDAGSGRATQSRRLLLAFGYVIFMSSLSLMVTTVLQPTEALRVSCHPRSPTPSTSSDGDSDSVSDSSGCTNLVKNARFMKLDGNRMAFTSPSAMRKCLQSFRFSEDRDLAVMDTVISGLDTFYVYKQLAKDSPSQQLPSRVDVVGKLRRVRKDAVAGKFKTTFKFFRKIKSVVQSLNDGHTEFHDNCMEQTSYVGLPVMSVVENGVQKVRVIPVEGEPQAAIILVAGIIAAIIAAMYDDHRVRHSDII